MFSSVFLAEVADDRQPEEFVLVTRVVCLKVFTSSQLTTSNISSKAIHSKSSRLYGTLWRRLFDAGLAALESISPGKGTYGMLRCCTLPSREKFPRQRPLTNGGISYWHADLPGNGF